MTGIPFRRMALFAIPVLALLLAMPGTTYAQRMTSELNGTVVDESGGVIPGADVLLINENSRSEYRSVTNADGFFAFSAVNAGTYTVQISLQGFSTYEVTGIPLNAGDSRSLRDLPLKVAAMAETVSVTAEVQLTPLEFEILLTLARDPGVVFTREQLMDRVWGYQDYAGGRVVDSHVARIRRKLGEDGAEPRFIRTVHGVGYAFREEAS